MAAGGGPWRLGSGLPGCEHVETHISSVWLTPELVFKLRKAVELPFVDFSTRAARNRDCEREVALNRRLAPEVYLGLAPVREIPEGLEAGPLAETISDPEAEHAVVMLRLPDETSAPALLARGALGPRQIEALAACMARFHRENGLGRPAPWSQEAWRDRQRRPFRESLELLEDGAFAGRARKLLAREAERAEALTPAFEARRLAGRAVDGHGDLHLANLWFDPASGAPQAIDCLEFDDELRRFDAASEMAFPAMDLERRGARRLGELLLAAWTADADDFDAFSVVDYFVAYRAAVRAKVATLSNRDVEVDGFLDLADAHLGEPRPGAAVLLCGTVGSGKSSVARHLAEALPAVAISSDRTRKRLAGVEEHQRLDDAHYSEAWTERVYAGLAERAAPVLRSGRAAVLDATFARRAHREELAESARRLGARTLLVEVTCAREEALRRLAARQQRGDDPSDAGPARLAASEAAFETTDAWPPPTRLRVATDRPGWQASLEADLTRALSGA